MGVFERIEAAKKVGAMVSLDGTLAPTLPPVGPTAAPVAAPSSQVAARAQAHAAFNAQRMDIPSVAEIHRITSLATERQLTPEEVEAVSRMEVLAEAFDKGWRLTEPQARAILWYDRLGGAFCPVGVGKGKTLITIMVAERAFRAGKKKIALVMPPGACLQFAVRGLPYARKHVPVSVPFHMLGGKTAQNRRTLARSGKLGCYVISSSLFSTKDTVDLLAAIEPELFVIDEAHEFKQIKNTARTRRLLDYIEQHGPQGVCLSGTITNKSVSDYHHLLRWCLKHNCPLPLSAHMAEQWGQVIDAEAEPTDSMTGPLRPLVDWARTWFPSESYSNDKTGFRKAYRLRLTSAPGVVSSGVEDLGVSLTVKTEPVEGESRPGWSDLQDLIKQVEELWVTPNGDEIEHAFHTYKWMHELSAGFYNLLEWPEPGDLARRRNIGIEQSTALVMAAKAHHEARQEYARKLRDWLGKYARDGLDTPLLVGANMSRVGPEDVGRDLFDPWQTMKDLEPAAVPPWDKRERVLERDSQAVQVCDYKVRAAIEWAQKLKGGGIIWFHHIELGEWLRQLAHEAGLNYLHCPAGKPANAALADLSNADRIVIASISAHGQAKELQHFQHQYVLQWPRSAKTAEQLLGRCHRKGQEADELVVVKNDSIPWDTWNFATCLNNSLYIQQTLGAAQKLVYCGYDPMPKIFPPEILRERGFDNVRRLDREGRELMVDLFGDFS